MKNNGIFARIQQSQHARRQLQAQMNSRAIARRERAAAVARFNIEPLEQRILLSADPVLLLPGLGGSFVDNNDADIDEWYTNRGIDPTTLLLDPLGDSYSDLVETLKSVQDGGQNTFVEGTNLFVANWDWRNPVANEDGVNDGVITGAKAEFEDGSFDTGLDYFAYWLGEAAKESFASSQDSTQIKVDVIAHSTGGLVARSYIQSDLYGAQFDSNDDGIIDANDLYLPLIDDLVLVGVPNKGVVDSWNLLHDDWSDKATSRVLAATLDNAWDRFQAGEVLHGPNGSSLDIGGDDAGISKQQFIAEYYSVLEHLLPTFDFLDTNPADPQNLQDLSGQPFQNTLLLDLNVDVNDSNAATISTAYDLINTTTIYSSESDTNSDVQTSIGPDPTFGFLVDEILTFADYLGRSPDPGETWFLINETANSGDSTVRADSARADFEVSDVEITAALVQAASAVSHGKLMSNGVSQQKILEAIGISSGYTVSTIEVNSKAESALSAVSYGILDPIELLEEFSDTFVEIFDSVDGGSLLNQNLPVLNDSLSNLLSLDFVNLFQTEIIDNLSGIDSTDISAIAAALGATDLSGQDAINFAISLTGEIAYQPAGLNVGELGSVLFNFDIGYQLDFTFGIDLTSLDDLASAVYVENVNVRVYGDGIGQLASSTFNAFGVSGTVDGASIAANAAVNAALISSSGDRRLTVSELANDGIDAQTILVTSESSMQAVVPIDIGLGNVSLTPVIFASEFDLFDGSFAPEVRLDVDLTDVKQAILDALASISLDMDIELPLDLALPDLLDVPDLASFFDFEIAAVEFFDFLSAFNYSLNLPDLPDLFDGLNWPDLGLGFGPIDFDLVTFDLNIDQHLEALRALLNVKFGLGLDLNLPIVDFDINDYLIEIGLLQIPDFDLAAYLPKFQLALGLPSLPDFPSIRPQLEQLFGQVPTLGGLLNYMQSTKFGGGGLSVSYDSIENQLRVDVAIDAQRDVDDVPLAFNFDSTGFGISGTSNVDVNVGMSVDFGFGVDFDDQSPFVSLNGAQQLFIEASANDLNLSVTHDIGASLGVIDGSMLLHLDASLTDGGAGVIDITPTGSFYSTLPVSLSALGFSADSLQPVVKLSDDNIFDSTSMSVGLDANLEPLKDSLLQVLNKLKDVALDTLALQLPLVDLSFDDIFFDLSELLDFEAPALEFFQLFDAYNFGFDLPDINAFPGFGDLFNGIDWADLGLDFPEIDFGSINFDPNLDLHMEALRGLLNFSFDLGLDLDLPIVDFDISDYLPEIGLMQMPNFSLPDLLGKLQLALGLPSLPTFPEIRLQLSDLFGSVPTLSGLLDFIQNIHLDAVIGELTADLGVGSMQLVYNFDVNNKEVQFNLIGDIDYGNSVSFDFSDASLGLDDLLDFGFIDVPIDVAGSGTLAADLELDFDLLFGAGLSGGTLNTFIGTNQLEANVTGNLQNLNLSAAFGPSGNPFISGDVVNGSGTITLVAATTDDQGLGTRHSLGSFAGHLGLSTTGSTLDVTLPISANLGDLDINSLGITPRLLINDADIFLTPAPVVTLDGLDGFKQIGLFALVTTPDILIGGVDTVLGSLEDLLDGELFGLPLPFIGDALQAQANFIGDMRSDVNDTLTAVFSSGATPISLLQDALFSAFTIDGSQLLVGSDGVALGSASEIEVIGGADFIQLNLSLSDEFDLASINIDFDGAVPGLGLDVNAQLTPSIGYGLDFSIGISLDKGFYIDTSSSKELEIFLDARLESGANLDIVLGFLELDVSDLGYDWDGSGTITVEEGSGIYGSFSVNILDTGTAGNDNRLTVGEIVASSASAFINASMDATAVANLDGSLSLGGSMFPSISTNFYFQQDFQHTFFGTGGTTNFGSAPVIEFRDTGLDLGSFLTDFVKPIFEEIGKAVEPIQPIIDILDMRLPLISDLAGSDTSLIDLAGLFGNINTDYLDAVSSIFGSGGLMDTINALPAGEQIIIDFGTYIVGGPTLDLRDSNTSLSQAPTATNNMVNLDTQISGASPAAKSATASLTGGPSGLTGLSFPLLTSPSNIFSLLTGKTVDLFVYDMPTLAIDFNYTRSFPIFPGLNARLGGSVGATVDFGFGFDTYGIQAAFDTDNPLAVFQGFYILDYAGSEITLNASITAGASLGVSGLVEAGVEGGIFAAVDFDLHDVTSHGGNDTGIDGANKIRGDEVIDRLALGPHCIFDTSGTVDVGLDAFLWVGLDLGFFGKVTIFDESISLFRAQLASFDFECAPSTPPNLATLNGGNLTLNMTEEADNFRVVQYTKDGVDLIQVFSGGVPHREVAPQGSAEDYQEKTFLASSITSISGNALGGNDRITISDSLRSDITITLAGGAGDDILNVDGGGALNIQGNGGDDQIKIGAGAGLAATPGSPNILRGGSGDDLILGSEASDRIEGDAGDDMLLGRGADDTIYGGSLGNASNSGDDRIDGGSGNDTLYGGDEGASVFPGDGSAITRHGDRIFGGTGDDSIHGGAGDDALFGAAGVDTIHAGSGDDYIRGGLGIDTLFGDAGGDTFDWYIGDGADLITGGNSIAEGAQQQDRVIFQSFVEQKNADNVTVKVDDGAADLVDVSANSVNTADVDVDFSGTLVLLTGIESLKLDTGEGQDHVIVHDLLPTTLSEVDVSLSAKRTTIQTTSGIDVFTSTQKSSDGEADVLEILGEAGNDGFVITTLSERDLEANQDVDVLRAVHDNKVTFTISDTDANVDIVKFLGGDGNDSIYASGVVSDLAELELYGDELHDILVGSPFSDRIDGGSGNDQLTGGAGVDTFVDSGGFDTLVEIRDADQSLFDNYFVVGHILGDDGTAFTRFAVTDEQGLPPIDPEFPAPVTLPINDAGDVYAGGAEVESLLDGSSNPIFERAILTGGSSNNIMVVGDRDGVLHVGVQNIAVDNFSGEVTLDNLVNLDPVQALADANEYYIVNVDGNSGSQISILDSGLTAGNDELFVFGTNQSDRFYLTAGSALGAGILEAGTGANLDLITHQGVNRLTINTLGGDDIFLSDDNGVQTVLYTGRGDDSTTVGTVPQIPDIGNKTLEFPNGVPVADRNNMTSGISAEMIVYGGDGDDYFEINHNLAKLYLHGGDHDDTFVINTFLTLNENPDDRNEITNLINLFGSGGSNRYSYLQNAPVFINGGDGIDTVVINGTPIGDTFVVTDSYVAGAGRVNYFTNIEKLELNTGGGQDEIYILSTSEEFELTVRGGTNDDTIHLGGDHPPLVFDPPEFTYQPPSYQVQDPLVYSTAQGSFDWSRSYFSYGFNWFNFWGLNNHQTANEYVDSVIGLYASFIPGFQVTNYDQVVSGATASVRRDYGWWGWYGSGYSIDIPRVEYNFTVANLPPLRTVTPDLVKVDPPAFAFKADAVYDVSDIRGRLTILGGDDFETVGDKLIVHNQDGTAHTGALTTVIVPVLDGEKYEVYKNGSNQEYLVKDGAVFTIEAGHQNDEVIRKENLLASGVSLGSLSIVTELRDLPQRKSVV